MAVDRCEPNYLANINFNKLELKEFYKLENRRLVYYSYSIERNRNGVELSRTRPEAISSIGFDDEIKEKVMNKSYLVVLLLTVVFGPLGLFYCSSGAAMGLLIAAVVFGSMTGGVGAMVVWFFSIIVGLSCVDRHNKRVALDEQRHEELLEAATAPAGSKSYRKKENS